MNKNPVDNISGMSYDEKLQLLKLLEEKENRVSVGGHLMKLFPDEGPYAWHKYPRHMQFIEAGTRHRERFFMGANRVGKSELGCFELCCHLTGQYPKWWMGKTFGGPIDAWCASDTNATTRDILQYKLLGPPGQFGTGLLAADRIENVKMKAGVPDGVESVKVKHKDGGWSYLGFKSYDQGRKTFQGTARHIVLLDEEPPLDIMAECLIRTMTVEGIVMITATPLKGLTPLVQEFLETAEKPHTDDEVRA